MKRFYLFLFIAILFLNLIIHPQAIAGISSLDSEAGAQVLEYEAGTLGGTGIATPSTTGSITAAGSSGLSSSASGSFVSGTGFATIGAAGIGVAGLTAAGIHSLQELAKSKYCAKNSKDSVCLKSYRITGDGVAFGCGDSGIAYTATSNSPLTTNAVTLPLVNCPGTGIYNSDGSRYGGENYGFLPSTVQQFEDPSPSWDKWSDDKRAAAIKLLNPSDLAGQLTNAAGSAISNLGDALKLAGNNFSKIFNDTNNTFGDIPSSIKNPSSNTNDGKDGSNGSGGNGGSGSAGSSGNGGSGLGGNGGGGGGGGKNPPPPTPSPTPTPTPSPTKSPDEKPADSCPLHPADSKDSLAKLADSLANFLPSSPDNVKIPTIISNMAGDQTLAGNLAVELYSAAWQYLTIICFVKFYKLIPGKST